MLPGGLVTLPLNRDWLTNYVLDHPSSAVFRDFHGNLDGEGRAAARLVLQAGQASSQVGKTMTLAFALVGPCDFASNAIAIEIRP